MEQRYSLAHHVTSHECTVTVVMLEERNESGRNRTNLLRSNVHEVYLCGRNNGEVGILTALNDVADECSIGTEGCVALTDNVILLLFRGKINHILVLEVYNSVVNLTVRSLYEAEVVDLCIYAE